ncbi:MAG: hypothetical protein LBP85_10440 [Prevotellaceae bacterium]|jgi:hypothetical protein|nr:hypothetical protein [Prevotellaceae bacterium]
MIPVYHNAFAPLWLDIPGSGSASVVITAGGRTIMLEVEILSNEKTVDIQKYVQSLLGDSQSMEYYVAVNGNENADPYIATRSAQQISETNDISSRVDKILTDRKKLTVYDGFPCEISIFQNTPNAEIINIPVTCNDAIITTVTWSAEWTNRICQKVRELFLFAEYTNPVCQREEATITYPSAQYTQPVCQKRDDSFDFATAEWTEPVCQLEEDTITMRIHLAKTSSSTGHILPNQMTISWKFSEDVGDFATKIILHAQFRFQAGMLIGIGQTNIDFIAEGTAGFTTQTIDDIDTLIGFDGAELVKINPDSVNGKQIAVWITIN